MSGWPRRVPGLAQIKAMTIGEIMHQEIESREKSNINKDLLGVFMGRGGGVRRLLRALFLVLAGGVSGGLLGHHYATTPELHRLCEFNRPGALESRLATGWDLNTVQKFAGRPAIPVVLASVFEVKCVDRSGIDPALALTFLQNGGRLSLDDLLAIYSAAKEYSVDGSPAQMELITYLDGRFDALR